MVKKYFSDWNSFEKLYLFFGYVIAITTTIVFKGRLISALYTMTYITNALLTAKGKVESYIFGFTGIIFYGIISFNQRYYGELIILIFMSLPLMIMGVLEWLKNRDNKSDNIIISTLSKKEIVLAFLSQVLLFGIYYIILKSFNTSEPIIGSLSIVMSLLALYFGARRSEISYFCYLANDVVIITLWLIPILNGDKAILSVLIGPLLLTINDVYGIYNWRRLKRLQEKRAWHE